PLANSLDKAQRKIKKAVATHRRRVLLAVAGCAAMLLAATSFYVVHFWEPFRPVAVTPEGWYSANTPAGNDVLGVDDGLGNESEPRWKARTKPGFRDSEGIVESHKVEMAGSGRGEGKGAGQGTGFRGLGVGGGGPPGGGGGSFSGGLDPRRETNFDLK